MDGERNGSFGAQVGLSRYLDYTLPSGPPFHSSMSILTSLFLFFQSSIDSAIKLRPTPKDLEELGPDFKRLWEEFYAGAPDKGIALLCSAAGNLSTVPCPPGSKTFSFPFCTLYPRAIGYSHITSGTNPWAPLRFNSGYLEDPTDIAILRWVYKHVRELARRMNSFRGEIPAGHPKFSSTTPTATATSTASVIPKASGPIDLDTPNIIYSVEDDKAIDDHHRATVSTSWHSLGTCAMKPRAAGGVVDPRLNVYGVENLKVAGRFFHLKISIYLQLHHN
jgi:alcohol oxidase